MKKNLKYFVIISLFIMNISIFNACENDEYKLTYNLNGGTGAIEDVCGIDSLIITNSKPSKSGYAFLGWSTIKNGEVEYKQDDSITLEDDITLYAVYSKAIKLTFDPNTGKVSTKSKNVYKGLTYGTLPTPTKKGYTFKGWYTSKSGGTLINSGDDVNITKSTTVYARWSKTKYTVTYVLNDGTNNSKNINSYYITTSTFTLKNPTRKGYTFKGWYTTSAYETKVTKITKGSTGNKTLYAKWSANKYTVVFNGNGYTSGKTTNQTMTYNKTYTLNANGFKRKGYSFVGWNKKKDGSGTSYTNKEEIKNLSSTNGAKVTLYAIWSKIKYTIDYELNGGVNSTSNPSSYYVTTSTITLKNPTKKGYTFKGWYTDSNFKTSITKIAKGSTGNKTLYAKWSKNSYTITYNLNGGTNNKSNITKYTIDTDFSFLEPTKKDYIFNGWYTDSKFNNSITTIEKGTTGNKTLYAKWTKEPVYTVRYYLDTGMVNDSRNPSSYKESDETIVLYDPTRKGYTFMGWYVDENFENRIYAIEKGSTSNLTLRALWVDNPNELVDYAIIYHTNGGNNSGANPSTYNKETETIILQDPTKAGYRFVGWFKDADFIEQITEIPQGSTGAVVLYANWEYIGNYEGNDYTKTYSFTNYYVDDDFEIRNKNHMYNVIYNVLNYGLEEATLTCKSSYTACINDFLAMFEDDDKLFSISNYVHPYNSYDSIGYRIYQGEITIVVEKVYNQTMINTTNARATTIMNSLSLNSLSVTNKIRSLHNYVINHVSYDERGLSNNEATRSLAAEEGGNAYAALVNGVAVCGGYTDAMAVFLEKIGVHNLRVASNTHIWNLVYVNNKWWHIDATWDDPICALGNCPRSDYFLISTASLHQLDNSDSHTFISNYYVETTTN